MDNEKRVEIFEGDYGDCPLMSDGLFKTAVEVMINTGNPFCFTRIASGTKYFVYNLDVLTAEAMK